MLSDPLYFSLKVYKIKTLTPSECVLVVSESVCCVKSVVCQTLSWTFVFVGHLGLRLTPTIRSDSLGMQLLSIWTTNELVSCSFDVLANRFNVVRAAYKSCLLWIQLIVTLLLFPRIVQIILFQYILTPVKLRSSVCKFGRNGYNSSRFVGLMAACIRTCGQVL